MSIQKARTLLAKFQSYSNAAEFIRSHGEEGFAFIDKKFNKAYLRENKKLFKKLDAIAQNYLDKYQELGVEIDCEMDLDY